ncbi:MAG: extracellular solute-binding protein [Chloroflexota bacterium]|nr:extracellular solute-binding protein [Chloroflexota bacterium]
MFQRKLGGAIAVAALVAACTGAKPTTAPATAGPATAAPVTGAPVTAAPPTEAPVPTIGAGEGELNIVIWDGYAERGGVDPTYDWVTPFETATGCKVNSISMIDSTTGVGLIEGGEYDGISASGDATTRLIQGGLVAPIDTRMLPNYANVFPGLKDLPHNTVDGVNYGVPHGRGPNLLGYNTEVVTTAPTSWDGIWEGSAPYLGKISIYDSSIFIADAALHLMKTKPELGIKDPYQLTQAQFDAAIALLVVLNGTSDETRPNYWGLPADQVAAFTSGDVVIGTTWLYQVNLLTADSQPVAAILPDEGATGWSDTWMMAKAAKHPNCMLMWMDHMMSAEANAQATVWFGEAPTSPQACAAAEALSPGHCDQMHATDEAYFSKVHYWATPQTDCKDDDAATTCVDQDAWTNAWTTLRGS